MHSFKALGILVFIVGYMLLSLDIGEARMRIDRHFVDYQGDRGYYVDVNSIERAYPNTLQMNLCIVHKRDRCMYVYRAIFNLEKEYCQYVYTSIYDYETKELLKESSKRHTPVGYQRDDMLRDVLEYAMEWKGKHIHKTTFGESWG